AMQPGAPIIKKWGSNTFMYEGMPMRRVRFGDVEAGFARADHIVAHTYLTTPVEHAPLETQTCQVKPEPDGRLTVHTNTQALYFTMDNTRHIREMTAGGAPPPRPARRCAPAPRTGRRTPRRPRSGSAPRGGAARSIPAPYTAVPAPPPRGRRPARCPTGPGRRGPAPGPPAPP